MKPSAIRDLARRYAAGELGLDEYRAQRRKLIDGVIAGNLKLEYGESSASRRKQPRLLWISAVIPAVLAIGIGTFMWIAHSHETIRGNTQVRVEPESGPTLIRSFLETNNWSDANLNLFLQHWNKLPSHEKKAARLSFLFPRLQSQLQEQIVSQQAVVDLSTYGRTSTDSASIHLAHLQQLAATLNAKPSD
jgi:hypothetical protein